MASLALVRLRNQINFDLLTFRRNPASTFFTVILPLIFLFLFTSIFGDELIIAEPIEVRLASMYVPSVLALAIISATAVNLSITMTTRRERGVLKRFRGTPVPPWIFMVSQAGAAALLSLLMTFLFVIVGWVFFDVPLQSSGVVGLIISVLLGAVCFSAMGLCLTIIIPSEEAAPAVTNALLLPLYFISGVFVPESQIPDWLLRVAEIFPVRHLALALQESFDPRNTSTVWPVESWLIIAAWGIVCTGLAMKFFKWTPRR